MATALYLDAAASSIAKVHRDENDTPLGAGLSAYDMESNKDIARPSTWTHE